MTRNLSLTIALALASVAAAAAGAQGLNAEDRAEAAAVLKAPISPTKAVQIAEHDGGAAYALGMEATHRGNWYEVEVLRNGVANQVRIDPGSGKVLGTSKAHGEDAAGAHALDGSQMTLAAAIAQAERTGNGTAMEATSMGAGRNAYVIVDVVHGKGVAHYRVSMRDGNLEAVPTSQSAG